MAKTNPAASAEDAADNTPAPAALSFEDVAELPSATREAKPNRFTEVVKGMKVGAQGGKRTRVPNAEVKAVRRELTAAGLACDPPVTVTMRTVQDGDTTVVMFGVREKIVQNRKPKPAAEDAPKDDKANSV